MPNRNHRGASSTNRPHSQHTHTPTHHSTPHTNVQRHHEQSTSARHSNAHHTSPVIREMHRPPRDYRTHPMEIPHPDAKRSSPVARHFTPPKFDDLWKAAHKVYPVGQHRDDDYVLDLDADVIGGKVAFNLRKNPKTGDRVYENACAIRMSYIL